MASLGWRTADDRVGITAIRFATRSRQTGTRREAAAYIATPGFDLLGRRRDSSKAA